MKSAPFPYPMGSPFMWLTPALRYPPKKRSKGRLATVSLPARITVIHTLSSVVLAVSEGFIRMILTTPSLLLSKTTAGPEGCVNTPVS